MLIGGRYARGEPLGEGAFGRTFLARDQETDTDVVVKELGIHGLPDWKPIEHFEREVRVLRSIEHPGVPQLLDALQEEHEGSLRLYIVTELIVGKTLLHEIEGGARWDEQRALSLMRTLLEILAYLHRLSPPVIHRDIKPGNIVLRPDGSPVLIDFGAVRDLAGRQPDGGLTVLGTPGYMAPEQSLGQADARSDIYALGTTLIHAFTHQGPLELSRTGMRIEFEHLVGLPEPIVEVLAQMVEPDPDDRPGRVSEILAAMDAPPQPESKSEPEGGRSTALARRRKESGLARRDEEGEVALVLPAAPRPIHRSIARRLKPAAVSTRMPLGHQVGAVLAPFGLLLASMIVAGSLAGAGAAMVLAAGVSIVLGIGGLIQFYRNRAKQMTELYRNGTMIEGRIISLRQWGPGSFSVAYEYQAGESWHESGFYTQEVPGDSLKVGAPLAVFFDPDTPSRHLALLGSELPPPDDP